jgi:hypothetical protein
MFLNKDESEWYLSILAKFDYIETNSITWMLEVINFNYNDRKIIKINAIILKCLRSNSDQFIKPQ